MEDSGGDMDVDQCLIGKFSSMGTTDKDVLISEFRKLLGFQLNAAGCEFFLDMTNWNLHAAIGAYYDFETPVGKLPSMAFVRDVTIGEGEAVPPDTEFLKTWRLHNNGDERWPMGCTLRFVNGEKMEAPDWVAVSELQPSDTIDISVRMRSPSVAGLHQGQWRIYNRNMIPFGDTIWVIISVEVGGLLGVTQQMSQFASGLGSPKNTFGAGNTQNSINGNPFAMSDNPMHNHDSMFGSNSTDKPNGFSPDGSNFLNKNGRTSNSNAFEDSEMCDTANKLEGGSLSFSPTTFKTIQEEMNPSCWNAKSPTAIGDSSDLISGACHSLHSITEESNSSDTNNNAGIKPTPAFLTSNSSYDLNARQASPFNSPSKLLELEKSFSSPDAPSPIRPTARNLMVNFEGSSAAQRLDFSSGS
uniref:Uncharacterized protein C6orf106 homolog n=1 Tax=Phallusia mammillata TaxID=59560 RepID=A0A6F9DG01_9ASCI|nr:uncharacterized protein C6orf106 homolog [Phallusia mammillata]